MTNDNQWPEERRKRYSAMMRERNLGKPKTPEQRAKMSAAKTGKSQSPEHIEKRTQAMIATKTKNRENKRK